MNNNINVQLKRLGIVVAVTLSLVSGVWAANVIESLQTADGKIYRDVRWGPVNNGKVVMFHSKGVALIAFEDLPEQYQSQFGYTPSPEAPKTEPTPKATPSSTQPEQPTPTVIVTPTQPSPARTATEMRKEFERMRLHDNTSSDTRYWKQYNDERATKLLFQGKLVDKATLAPITGYVVTSQFHAQDGNKPRQATVVELAVRRTDTKEVADAMSLRPALWRGTGQQILLLDYRPDGDMNGTLIRVYGKEIAAVEERRSFVVGIEPSFKEWLRLRNLQ